MLKSVCRTCGAHVHSTQETGWKDVQTARVRRLAVADVHPINASPSDPVRSSCWLTCCRAGRFSIRQEGDGAPADAQRSASAAHGWEAKQNSQQYHPPAGFHPSHVLMWAWNVPRKRHFHWVTSWIPSPLTPGSPPPSPSTTPPLWGWAFAPWLSTHSNKTKMLQMEGQRVREVWGCKPWGAHFDEFLTTQPGLEQMGSVSRALLHGCV